MQTVLIIIHVIISVVLIAVVLLQHGKQQGLSGAIAGGAETFFGKNKGRTVDAMLKKFTAVIAALFIISSVALAFVSVAGNKAKTETPASQTEEGQATGGLDAEGNLVDENGNIIMTAEEVEKQLGAAGEEAANEAAAETENAEAQTAETTDAE